MRMLGLNSLVEFKQNINPLIGVVKCLISKISSSNLNLIRKSSVVCIASSLTGNACESWVAASS